MEIVNATNQGFPHQSERQFTITSFNNAAILETDNWMMIITKFSLRVFGFKKSHIWGIEEK
jgi:hypothetical protein